LVYTGYSDLSVYPTWLNGKTPFRFCEALIFCGLISIALSNALIASLSLFNLDSASPLLFQVIEVTENGGLISIDLS
jgi:hypothetical protein